MSPCESQCQLDQNTVLQSNSRFITIIPIILGNLIKFVSMKKACNDSNQYSRLQNGDCGENAVKVAFICVHVVAATPINSKPESQL